MKQLLSIVACGALAVAACESNSELRIQNAETPAATPNVAAKVLDNEQKETKVTKIEEAAATDLHRDPPAVASPSLPSLPSVQPVAAAAGEITGKMPVPPSASPPLSLLPPVQVAPVRTTFAPYYYPAPPMATPSCYGGNCSSFGRRRLWGR